MRRIRQSMQPLLQFYKHHVQMIWRHHIRNQMPIIIYQPGKVGSSTIYQSLVAVGDVPVYQVHYLSLDALHSLSDTVRQSGRRVTGHILDGFALNRYVIRADQPAKIITLVRDPIARNLSDFFENFELITGRSFTEGLSVTDLSQLFLETAQKQSFWRWYNGELKTTLGIDVYQQPFLHEQGYVRWQSENYDVLLLRIETDDAQIESALTEFTGYSSVKLIEKNRGDAKNYSDAYRSLKNSIRLPHDDLHQTLNTQYARHFYTESEREAIYQRWVDPQTVPSES